MEQAIDKAVLARLTPDPGLPKEPPLTDNPANAARKHAARRAKDEEFGIVYVDPLTRYVTRIKPVAAKRP